MMGRMPSSSSGRGPGAYPIRRRADLLERLRTREHASTAELARELGVSDDTIRRDLAALSRQGAIVRSHGGASIAPEERFHRSTPFPERARAHASQKDRIARAAAGFVQDLQSVIINGGSTTLLLARHIAAKRGVTVVTNNLVLPRELYSRGQRDVYLLGGQFHMRSQVTIGPIVLSDSEGMPQPIHADWAIIGVAGVTEDGYTWSTSVDEAGMMRSMIESSRRALILADSSKFGHAEFAQVVRVSEGSVLVTDAPPSRELAQSIAEAGGEIVIAP